VLKLLPAAAQYLSGAILFNDSGDAPVDILSAGDGVVRKLRGSRISMIFQEPMTSLNPLVKCGEQVMEAIRLHEGRSNRDAREKTLELFRRVELPDPANMLERYPHQLSGGQKQRVMIAMAISCGPSLLIADEPTTALDVTVQKHILSLIKELQLQLQMGVIFITHDLGLVSEVADQVVVMYKGKIVEQGATKKIIADPAHPYTKALLACRPILHTPGTRLPMVSDFMEDEGTGNSNVVLKPIVKKDPAITSEKRTVLEVKNLRVWFPSKKNMLGKPISFNKAVDGVSFEMYHGETLGLVGESGCGKTTLGRAILRLADIHEGQILYKGRDLAGLGRQEMKPLRKEIQIIFQDPYSSLNPRMPIGIAIKETLEVYGFGKNHKEQEEKTVHLLEKVGLKGEHFNRYPHEFSGGQRQRIGIARALALDPAFMVCDESVSALDVSVQAQVLNLLDDLKKEYGFTTLFISHDLSVVHHVSDRIMVMNKGKIEEIGLASEIYHNPSSPYTQRLISAIPGASSMVYPGRERE
jgi:peptide/nickel transport system ATP-binding protein